MPPPTRHARRARCAEPPTVSNGTISRTPSSARLPLWMLPPGKHRNAWKPKSASPWRASGKGWTRPPNPSMTARSRSARVTSLRCARSSRASSPSSVAWRSAPAWDRPARAIPEAAGAPPTARAGCTEISTRRRSTPSAAISPSAAPCSIASPGCSPPTSTDPATSAVCSVRCARSSRTRASKTRSVFCNGNGS